MTKNVVEFPKDKIVRENINEDLMLKREEQGTKNFADAFCAELESYMLSELVSCDVDINDETFLKDFYVTASLLRATVYRSFKVDHPLHPFMDENIVILTKEVDTEL